MRELKFRAWDGEKIILNVLPFEWDFCLTAISHKCVESSGSGFLGSGGDEALFQIRGYRYKSLMQYTGLKDRNGVDIYEGDVVRWFINDTSTTAAVYYDDKAACFWMGCSKEHGSLVINDWMRGEYELLGNIHENPELLEDKEA